MKAETLPRTENLPLPVIPLPLYPFTWETGGTKSGVRGCSGAPVKTCPCQEGPMS